MDLRELRYGIEIETVKRTREQIAWAIHSVVGGHVRHIGAPSCYDPWEVEDLRGRKWKVVNDASLTNVPSHLRAELVSPVLTYDDLEQLQEVVRAIRKAGGKINSQCGIHIHIDAEPFDGRKLGNLAKVVYKQEPLILHALGINSDRLRRYTRPVSDELIRNIERQRPKTKAQLNRIWYGYHNNQPQHYDNTRYHGVNLHNVWYRGTVEFRWFEATLHAGKIKAYLQFCLGIAAKALNGRAASSRNNHPIRSGIIIGTHNGTIYNADYLFRRLGLPRYAEVDSELLFRLADRFAPDGTIDGRGFRKALRLCRGQMSAVLASRLDPGAITIIKGNKPLSLRYSRKHRTVIYASEPEYIEAALDDLRGWRELEIPPLTMLTFRHENLKEWQSHPFRFVCQERKGTLPEGVKA